jgi:hypothetical protein
MLPRRAILGGLFLIMILPGIGLFVEGAMTKASVIASIVAFFILIDRLLEPTLQ